MKGWTRPCLKFEMNELDLDLCKKFERNENGGARSRALKRMGSTSSFVKKIERNELDLEHCINFLKV